MYSTACIPKDQKPRDSDPLAGLPWFNRFQTHQGDGIPLGLYQDASLTTPSTLAHDAVGGFKSASPGSGAMTQEADASRPTLEFEGGFPYLLFNGTKWFNLPDQSSLTQGEIFLLMMDTTRTSAVSGNYIYNMSSPLVNNPTSFLPYSENGFLYDSFGTTVRKEEISNAIPQSEWFVYNASSRNGQWRCAVNGTELYTTTTNTAGFRSDPTFATTPSGGPWPGGKLIACLIFSLVLTNDQRAQINNYLATLHS